MKKKKSNDVGIFQQGHKLDVNFECKLRYKGHRESFNLGTNIRGAAQEKANRIWFFLRAKGWEATLKEYKPQKKVITSGPALTVGEFLAEYEERAKLKVKPNSRELYCVSFRKVAVDLAGLERFKCGTATEHNRRVRAKVDALPISIFTREALKRWQSDYVTEGDPNPVEQLRRNGQANGYFHAVSAIFGRFEKAENPTKGIKRLPERDPLYDPEYQIDEVLDKAWAAFADNRECLKAIVLCALCGLRRLEADRLMWSQIDFIARKIRVRTTEYISLKRASSTRNVSISDTALGLLHGWHADEQGELFVMDGEMNFEVTSRRAYYRADRTWKPLNLWLKLNGIKAQKSIHDLRKAFGDDIDKKYGIHAAAAQLGHKSTRMTELHYASRHFDTPSSLGFGPPKIIETDFKQAAADGGQGTGDMPTRPARKARPKRDPKAGLAA